MLGRYSIKLINDWEYEKVRCYLLSNTAGFYLLKDKVEKKHRFKNLSRKAAKEKLMFATLFGNNSELKKDLDVISKKLKINETIVENLLSGWINFTGFDFTSLPFYASIEGESLPEGLYIRVEPHTREETVIKTYKYIQNEYKYLDKHTGRIGPKIIIPKRNKKPDDLEHKIKFFTKIEKTILRKLKDAKDFPDQSYDDKLINDSIKFAGGEVFKKIIKLGSLKDIYYSLQNYYDIPNYSTFKLFISQSL